MIVKTKRHQLTTQTYLTIGLKNVFTEWWWVWLIPVGIMLIPIIYSPALWWCLGIALTATILYVLFWVIQFVGITQLEQYKVLFDKLTYEISSQQILIKVDANRGMPIEWKQVQKASVGKDHFLFVLSKAQFIHLPFSVFRSDLEIKFVETVLKRKGFIPEVSGKPAAAAPSK